MESLILIPIFGGQAVTSLATTKEPLRPTKSASATVLLDACYEAFHSELASLTASEVAQVGICTSDFARKESILGLVHEKYRNNPVLTGSALAVMQCMLYLAHIEGVSLAESSRACFTTGLHSNICHRVGILGFSSGIISACVIAASPSVPAFIYNSVEAYKVALWIGIRSQIHRAGLLRSAVLEDCQGLCSWSMVLGGLKELSVLELVRSFNEPFGVDHVTVTAVIGDQRVSISGMPHHLAAFAKTLPDSVVVYPIDINALYHRADLNTVRDYVLADITSRNIHFPILTDLITPIRSTFTGDLIFRGNKQVTTLVEAVVDMVLIHPVHWDKVIQKCVLTIPVKSRVKFLNLGLGTSLMKRTERVFMGFCYDILNISDSIISSNPTAKHEPIAIIGMAVKMPGASNIHELWKILESGKNTLSTVPEDRFPIRDYTANVLPGRTIKTSTGNFVDDIGDFDHRFFNISAREARSMDPQQRNLLEVGYQALEHAGYVPYATDTFNPDMFGCFIGAATHDYVHNLTNDIDTYYSTGNLTAFLSGRLSYCLNLSGPSIVVDTACSSSMVAIHQAVRALVNHDCHAALAGGVNVISSPDMFIGLDKGHFLSPSGQCKSFDALADGYSRSEGCGVFVLKRLADALKEDDRVLGVIHGVEINQSGQAQSITHPHIPTQEALFRRVLRCSNIKSNYITVVEAHGTGTQAGDISELESIRRVLAIGRTVDNPLHITSIKANIGHLEAASGCASLAKVLLMFQHKTIPRQISLKTLNPKISRLDTDHIQINTKNIPWLPASGIHSRIAMVNNFGAAGSNTALIVEEHVSTHTQHLHTPTPYMFGLSAKDEATLETLRSNFIDWLKSPENLHTSLLDIAYTSTARRQIYRYRTAGSASSRSELISILTNSPVFDAKRVSGAVLVFSGQGSHHGIAEYSKLYQTYPIFRYHVDECEAILSAAGFPGILPLNVQMNDFTEQQQSTFFAMEYSLAQLWLSWGVKPIAVMGHSLGEYAALVTAGILTLKDALVAVASRARAMFAKCAKSATGMLVVSLGSEKVQAILYTDHRFSDLSIACFNGAQECVVSGSLSTLESFASCLVTEHSAKVARLRVPYGYHSPAMSILTNDLLDMSKKLRASPTRLPYISTVLGQFIVAHDPDFPPHDYLVRHCIEPVRFTQAIESYLQSSVYGDSAVYIDVGPQPAVLGLLRSFETLSTSSFIASVRRGEEPSSSLCSALEILYVSNCPLDWRRAFKDLGSAACVDLPPYPFIRQRFWVPFTESSRPFPSAKRKYAFLSASERSSSAVVHGNNDFKISLEDISHFIQGHKVGETPLCSASVYLELVQEAIYISLGSRLPMSNEYGLVLKQLAFPNPLTWNSDCPTYRAHLTLTLGRVNHSFTVGSRTSIDEGVQVHANGNFMIISSSDIQKHLSGFTSSILQRTERLMKPESTGASDIFSARTIYEVIFPRVVTYAKDFQTLRSLVVSPDGMEATGVMQLGSSCEPGGFVVHPFYVDTLLHVAGFLSNLRGNLNDAYICNEINAVYLLPPYFHDKDAAFSVHCELIESSDQNCVVANTHALSTGGANHVLVARLEGIRFQRVRLSSLKAGLAALSCTAISSVEVLRLNDDGHSSASKESFYKLFANVCAMDPKDISDDLFLDQLGIDSLTRLEVFYGLLKANGYTVQDLLQCQTVKHLVDMAWPHDVKSRNRCPQTPVSSNTSCISSSATLVPHGEVANSPVKKILANILDIEEDCIKDDADLGSLGLDSFASIEALHTLRHDYNLEAPRDLFTGSRTIRDVENQIEGLESSALPRWPSPISLSHNPFKKMCDALSVNKSLVLLQNVTSPLPPLVLIHDGSGLIISYERLLCLDRRVWAISNPRFSSPNPWRSVMEMARYYADLIFNEFEGPIILGGWSFGGVVSFEVARQLKSRSIEVRGLVLIDSPSPIDHAPLTAPLVNQILSGAETFHSESRNLCRTQFLLSTQLLNDYAPLPMTQSDGSPRLVFIKSSQPYISSDQTEVPTWLSDRSDPDHITAGWRTVSPGSLAKTLDIPGNHFEAFNQENIVAVSSQIKQACHVLDSM